MGYLQRRLNAFKYAVKGIVTFFVEETHAKIHLSMSLLVIGGGLYFRINYYEWIACIICIFTVLTAEMINSAIENLTNIISPQHNALAGKVKDLSAGAVLISSIGSAIIGFYVFGSKMLELL